MIDSKERCKKGAWYYHLKWVDFAWVCGGSDTKWSDMYSCYKDNAGLHSAAITFSPGWLAVYFRLN